MAGSTRAARRTPFVVAVLAAFVFVAGGAALATASPAAARVLAPGAFAWVRVPDRAPDVDTSLYLLARGPSGTVYAAGVRGSADTSQAWLVKYRADGRRAWSRTWGDTGGGSSSRNVACDLAVDAAGNAYLAVGHREGLDWATALVGYDARGVQRWESAGVAASYRSEPICSLAVAAGTVYLAGSTDHAGNWDGYLARYSSADGSRTSLGWYAGPGVDALLDLAVTPAGDCYTCGSAVDVGSSRDGLLVKWVAGEVSWAATWHGATDQSEQWSRVVVDETGGVRVAGSAAASSGVAGALAAARYDAAGALLWSDVWSSGGQYGDAFQDAAVDRSGRLWVIGYTHTARIGKGLGEVVRWTASGKLTFAKTAGSSTRPVSYDAVTCDTSGNAYVVGRVKSGAGGTDPLAVKYAPNGAMVWRSTASLPGRTTDYLANVVLGGAGALYASGGIGPDAATTTPRGLLAKLRR